MIKSMQALGVCEKVEDGVAVILVRTKWSALFPTLAYAQTMPGN